MEESLVNISNTLNSIANALKTSHWYDSSWFFGLLGLIGVVLGVILDRLIRDIEEKRQLSKQHLSLADNSIRFQFSQLLPRLQGLAQSVKSYTQPGTSPSFQSETGWRNIKGTLVQNRIKESDEFMKKMDSLMELQRYLSDQVGWPNQYTQEIQDVLDELIEKCQEIVLMTPQEILERFHLDKKQD